MSWFKKAKLAAQKVVDTASKTAKDLADEVESEFGGETWYEGAKKTATQIGVETNKLYQGSKEFGSDIVQELGSTELGKNVGDKTRVAAQFLSQLPVFSLAHDVLKSRHGIKALYTSFQDNPHDPLRALWLAEALGRVHSDLKVYSGIRSVISPSYALISQSLKLASKLGDEPTDPTQIRLLKHAFSLSLRRLKENPRDAVALHILARIYLVQNDPVEAVYFSKLAIVANTSDSNPWITLSRAYLALEQLNNARRAADKAVNFGQQYGREILADIHLLSIDELTFDDIEAYDRIKGSIPSEAFESYFGVYVEGISLIEGVGKEQFSKIENQITKLDSLFK